MEKKNSQEKTVESVLTVRKVARLSTQVRAGRPDDPAWDEWEEVDGWVNAYKGWRPTNPYGGR